MADPIHRSVLLDHQMEIDGVLFHERKELETFDVEANQLVHMR